MKLIVAAMLATACAWTAFAAEDLAIFPTADLLWFHIGKLREGPITPPATDEERQKLDADTLVNLNASVAEFLHRYPNDPRRWEAQLLRLDLSKRALGAGNSPVGSETLKTGWHELATTPEAPRQIRAEAQYALVQFLADELDDSDSPQTAKALDAEAASFQKEFPTDPRFDTMGWLRVTANEKFDAAKADALLRELSNSSNAQVAATARRQLAVKELKKKPLDLTFTAVDGTAVDLSKLRGKVVLLDFWATWCGPCIREIPNVVSTYTTHHQKGFEIVGISLDRDKQKLLTFTKDKGMTWPQYFDGKTWQNDISTRFGVSAIPAMWLVDKKGFIRSTEARRDLSAQIEKLLAE